MSPTPTQPAHEPADEELARQIGEFENQCPTPELNEILADAKWFDEHWGKPTLTQYCGNYVAVLNGAVVGHGIDALRLQLDTVKKFQVHPQRLIIEYIPRPTF